MLEINKENLAKMIKYIKTIDKDYLNMKGYSSRDDETIGELLIPLTECGSVGCIIGHCVHLDTPENIREFIEPMAGFNFYSWSHKFVFKDGIEIGDDEHEAWYFMFGARWGNSLEEAIARMNYMLEIGGVPEWFDEDEQAPYEVSMIERYGDEFLKEHK